MKNPIRAALQRGETVTGLILFTGSPMITELAAAAGVGHLYLTHISRRYREREVLEEAAAVFPNVSVARDFDHIQIRRPDG